MRVVRTVAGLVLLTIGLPVLLVGGALWTLMQHRDAGGAFSGSLERVSTSGRAIVVPDVDALLREDAAFVRAGDTRLRLTASGETFFGLAPAGKVREYLAGAAYSRVDAVTVARGDLPVRVAPVTVETLTGGLAGPAASGVAPGSQSFWTRQGSGSLEWTANEVDGRELSLVVMRVDAGAGLTADVRASATPGWLAPTTWTVIALGALLIGAGIAALAWPLRARDVVFVVDPSQVPQVSARLGGLAAPAGPPPVWPALPAAEVAEPLPVLAGDEPRSADGSWPEWPSDSPPGRPATLADALAGAGKEVPPPPGPAWPPTRPDPSAWTPAPDAWRRAEAARLAGLPAVNAAAAQLSVESVPTSGAPAGAATAIPATRPAQTDGDSGASAGAATAIPATRPAQTDGDSGVSAGAATAIPATRPAQTDTDSGPTSGGVTGIPTTRPAQTDAESARRPPAPRADADVDGPPTAGVAQLRAVRTDDAERPAKRTSRTATKKRPVVFVDTATEPTGESPDRPVVATRPRTRAKTAPQPRDAANTKQTAAVSDPTTDAALVGPPADAPATANPADATPAAKPAKRKPRRAAAVAEQDGQTETAQPSDAAIGSVESQAGDSATAQPSDAAAGSTQPAPARAQATEPHGGETQSSGSVGSATAGTELADPDKTLVGQPGDAAIGSAQPATAGVVDAGKKLVAPSADAVVESAQPATAGTGIVDGDAGERLAGQPGDAVGSAQPVVAGTPVVGPHGGEAAGTQPGADVVGSAQRVAAETADPGKPDALPSGAAAVGSSRPASAGAVEPKAAKATKARKRGAAAIAGSGAGEAAELNMTGTEVIESTGSDADQPGTEHGIASAGAPIGTGALVGTTGDPAVEAKPARRTSRTKKAADGEPAAKPAKTARAPRRKATTESAGPAADAPTEPPAVEAKPEDGGSGTGATATGTPFGGPLGTTMPAKARRRKTAAGLPSPESTDPGPAHTAVAALAAKRPPTRRRPTKAATTRPTDNRANPTDQAS